MSHSVDDDAEQVIGNPTEQKQLKGGWYIWGKNFRKNALKIKNSKKM